MKKGFTLVELLAVIAILAILIIIALPNVLEMFNNAKKDVFVTEVKTVSSSAEKRYLTSQMSGDAETTFCRSETDSINPLNMSGAEKNYYVELNNIGRIKYIVVWDDNRYIKYRYSYSKSVTDLEKSDIIENSNENITCGNVLDELSVGYPAVPENIELVLSVAENEDDWHIIEVTSSILNSESMSEVKYKIYRKKVDDPDSKYILINETVKNNNSDLFLYIYSDYRVNYEPGYGEISICDSPMYRVEIWSESGEKLQEEFILHMQGC